MQGGSAEVGNGRLELPVRLLSHGHSSVGCSSSSAWRRTVEPIFPDVSDEGEDDSCERVLIHSLCLFLTSSLAQSSSIHGPTLQHFVPIVIPPSQRRLHHT